MSVKIGLLSDVHATAAPLMDALEIFEQENVDLVLCAGDIAGYGVELEQSIKLLTQRDCITILGNHDVWYMDQDIIGRKKYVETFFHNLADTWGATVEGKRIFAVHASPPASMRRGITLLDQYEKIMLDKKAQWALELERYEFDVLIVGHTHQVFAEMLGRTMVINPGSTKFNNTCAILSLPDVEVQILPLPGKEPRQVWHWGMSM